MRTILVIEDNDDVRENTAELLELSNYHVISAGTGKTGFELAKQFNPDIILYDIMMQGTNDKYFFKRVKEDDVVGKIPLICFSAGSYSTEFQNELMTGTDEYLIKPFTEEELLSIILRRLPKET